jgi:hypothetical protein
MQSSRNSLPIAATEHVPFPASLADRLISHAWFRFTPYHPAPRRSGALESHNSALLQGHTRMRGKSSTGYVDMYVYVGSENNLHTNHCLRWTHVHWILAAYLNILEHALSKVKYLLPTYRILQFCYYERYQNVSLAMSALPILSRPLARPETSIYAPTCAALHSAGALASSLHGIE